ncbi:MAG: aldo/keto reductase [Christensenellales bacterium]
MKYNLLGNTGLSVSEIGLGGEHLEGKDARVVEETIQAALSGGINIFDIFMSEPNIRTDMGKAFGARRKDIVIQGHIRPIWRNGQYERTMEIKLVKAAFEDLLKRLDTDYIDIGMLHLVDTPEDYETIFDGEIYQYALELKRRGVIGYIGMSSHVPSVAQRAVDAGLIDVLLFSLNPAIDLLSDQTDIFKTQTKDFEHAQGIDPSRRALYEACAERGVGITVMKTLAAGILLDKKKSPFGRALTVPQCIHYALNRPAVASVMLGFQTPRQVHEALAYETATQRQKDYSPVLLSRPQFSMQGRCMYCNHCLPCPSHISIAHVNQYLDLAKTQGAVSPTLREHYASLESTAENCIACGQCEERCPFGVAVRERMREAKALFER